MTIKRVFFFLLSVSSLIPFSKASSQWVQAGGPYGGNVQAMAVSGTTIFAGTSGGVFRSTDNGASWAPANNGLTSTLITVLTANGTNIFAGTYDAGVFRSSDGGSSWTTTGAGLPSSYITALAVIGTNLFAGSSNGGVSISTDNGKSWTQSNTGMTGHTVHSYAFNGADLFAGTDYGVFSSTNNGATWSASTVGLPVRPSITAIIPIGTSMVVATVYGVYVSTDTGKSWGFKYLGLPWYTNAVVSSFAIIGTNLFAGDSGQVFLSTNNGTNWSYTKPGLSNTQVNVLLVSGTKLFAGTDHDGVFVSNDSGKSWTPSNTGMTNLAVSCLPVEGSKLFAETSNGAFLSTNDGASWTAPGTGGVPSFPFSAFAEKDFLTHLFAYGQGGSIFGEGIYTSTDSGKTWSRSNGWPYSFPVFAMVANDVALFASADSVVAVSFDNGASWELAETGLPLDGYYMISLAVMNNNIFAGANGGGIYMSSDNGGSWNEVTAGTFSLLNFQALAANGTNLFAGTDDGIFISIDSGKNWTAVNTGLTDSNILSFAVVDSNLFAGTSNDGVWRRPLSQMLPSPYAIKAAQDSLEFGSVFIGKDSTISFKLRNTGSASLRIASIDFIQSDSIFIHSAVTLPRTLLPGDSLSFDITFKPVSAGVQARLLVISSEATQLRTPLIGRGIDSTHKLSAQYAALSFGNVILGKDSTLPLTLKNAGNAALTITSLNFIPTGTVYTHSAISLPATLQPNDSLSFTVTFTPSVTGTQLDTIVALSEANVVGVPMSGTGVTALGVKGIAASDASLQSYPNPFSQSARITFSCAEPGEAEVTIVDLLGAEVARLFSGEMLAGKHEFIWDASAFQSGVYECLIRTNGNIYRIPLSLIR